MSREPGLSLAHRSMPLIIPVTNFSSFCTTGLLLLLSFMTPSDFAQLSPTTLPILSLFWFHVLTPTLVYPDLLVVLCLLSQPPFLLLTVNNIFLFI